MDLLSLFRPGGTDEGSQVVDGLGLWPPPSPRHDVTRRAVRRSAPSLQRLGYLQAPRCGCVCSCAECIALWMTRNDITASSLYTREPPPSQKLVNSRNSLYTLPTLC